MTYGNNTEATPNYVDYTYDRFGNNATVSYNGTVAVRNFADSGGTIIRTQDLINNLEHRISYDSTGRAISKETLDLTAQYNTDSWLRSTEYDYDLNNNITKSNIKIIVEGDDCDFIVDRKNDSDTYLIIPKTADGWKIGIGSNTKK